MGVGAPPSPPYEADPIFWDLILSSLLSSSTPPDKKMKEAVITGGLNSWLRRHPDPCMVESLTDGATCTDSF